MVSFNQKHVTNRFPSMRACCANADFCEEQRRWVTRGDSTPSISPPYWVMVFFQLATYLHCSVLSCKEKEVVILDFRISASKNYKEH